MKSLKAQKIYSMLLGLSASALTLSTMAEGIQAQIYIPVPQQRYFGAFAYSSSENLAGYATGYLSRRDAEKNALEACAEGGVKGCVLLGWFSNQCASLATTPDGAYAIEFGLGGPLVARAALEKCREVGGENCKIKKTICTGV